MNRSIPCCLALLGLLSGPSLGAQVAGVVIDSVTRAPIGGALVTVQATPTRTTTAADGSFSLPIVGAAWIVAAKKGYFNAGLFASPPASGVQIAAEPVQVANNSSYQLIDPTTCASCHPDQFSQWQGSPMSRAGTNTWVYDTFDGTGSTGGMGGFVYNRDSVFAQSHPDSECASCHQPEPWIAQVGTPLEPIGNLSAGAMHGISCETCHKMADVNERKLNYPGIYPGVVEFNRPSFPITNHQVMYGVLGDVDVHYPGFMRASYQPQLVAAVCGTCHQDKNDPDGNGNFEEANGVISEPTYFEWLASPYGNPAAAQYQTCVDCHMPAYGATQACSQLSFPRDPETIRSHKIEGTTPAFLENAVDLRITVNQGPVALAVVVEVDNSHTGHHVPTGVTVRNMVLLVEAWQVDDGQRLHLAAGPTLHPLAGVGAPEQGYYAGLPGKLYAKLIHDGAGNAPTFFTDATGIVFDNRIPAGAIDTTKYVFTTPSSVGQVTVRARLIYRRAFRALVDAKQWTTDGHGAPLADVAAPYFGHLMEEANWSSAGPGPVTAFGSGCGGLVAGSQHLPTAGSTKFAVTLAGAANSVPAFLALGLSNTSWGGIPLPLDMSPIGLPGCSLLVSPDLLEGTTTDAQGAASVTFSIPHAGLIGARAHAQWGAIVSPAVWAVSDGLSITVQR